MKKIYLLLIALVVLLLSSCDANDNFKCYESVQQMYPDAIDIVVPLGEKYKFIVRDYDSIIYYVETMEPFNPEVSKSVIIFKD